jgi:hypothetical protein
MLAIERKDMQWSKDCPGSKTQQGKVFRQSAYPTTAALLRFILLVTDKA